MYCAALLVDSRLSPYSRTPEWDADFLFLLKIASMCTVCGEEFPAAAAAWLEPEFVVTNDAKIWCPRCTTKGCKGYRRHSAGGRFDKGGHRQERGQKAGRRGCAFAYPTGMSDGQRLDGCAPGARLGLRVLRAYWCTIVQWNLCAFLGPLRRHRRLSLHCWGV